MKLLRIMAVVLAICFVTSSYGQSSSGGTQTGSNQAQPPATQTLAAPAKTPTPEPNGQSAQAATDTQSDLQSEERHHRYHVRLGAIGVGAGYSRFSGPFFYNPFWYGFYPYNFGYSPFFYDPFFYSPFYAPGYLGGFSYSNGKGEVKLSGAPKTAQVYLDGAYAGPANKLKSIWLEPGAYDLSVSSAGTAPFHQRIYVLSGRSLKIATNLSSPETKPKTTEEKQ